MKKLEFCDQCRPNGQLLQEQLIECETKAKLLAQENNGLATRECGLYETWRTQRSVRGSSGSVADGSMGEELSGELPCFGDIRREFCSSKAGESLCSRCRARQPEL